MLLSLRGCGAALVVEHVLSLVRRACFFCWYGMCPAFSVRLSIGIVRGQLHFTALHVAPLQQRDLFSHSGFSDQRFSRRDEWDTAR